MRKSVKTSLKCTVTLIVLSLVLYIYANQNTSIPILLYHHVNYVDKDSLAVTPELFESQMKYLYENQYKSLSLDEIDSIIREGKKFPPKSVVITFDDGYLDNWIYAYPILKKYKMKAIIFAVTSYIKNSKYIRPNLEDVWKGRFKIKNIPSLPDHNTINLICAKNPNASQKYFFTWEEAEKMVNSGFVDIQSHTHTHKSIFTSNKIIDFNKDNYWGVVSSTNGDDRLGIPIYERVSSITSHKFFDDLKLRDFLADYVDKHNGKVFFDNKDYKKILFKEIENYKKEHPLRESVETDKERDERIKGELVISRALIERKLEKKSKYIAWPWGEHNDLTLKLAKEAGYKGAFLTEKGVNELNPDLWFLKRIKVWPRGNWWFATRLLVYSNAVWVKIFTFLKI